MDIGAADITTQQIPHVDFQLFTSNVSKPIIQYLVNILVETVKDRKKNSLFFPTFCATLVRERFNRKLGVGQAASGRLLIGLIGLSALFQARL